MKMRMLVAAIGAMLAACEGRVDPPPAPAPPPVGKTDPAPKLRVQAASPIASGPEAQRSIPELVAALGKDDIGVRRTAEVALKAIGPSVVPEMVPLLRHPKARWHALEVLRTFGPESRAATPTLIDLLEDPELCLWVENVLRKIGRPAVPALLEVFVKGDIRRRHKVLGILGGMGAVAEEAIPKIERHLINPNLAPATRTCLDRIGPNATPLHELAAGLNSPDPAFRSRAARDLAVLGPCAFEAVPALLQAFQQRPTDLDLDRALRRIGPPVFMPVLPLLRSKDDLVARRAMGVLNHFSAMPPADALPELLEAVKDPRAELKVSAFRLLSRFGPDAKAAIPDAAAVLGSSDIGLKQGAAGFLRSTGSPDAALPLAWMLQSPDGNDRRMAAIALIGLHAAAAAAEPQVRTALKDDLEDVRILAEKILRGIEGAKK